METASLSVETEQIKYIIVIELSRGRRRRSRKRDPTRRRVGFIYS
jgi:hypothetical protein